MKMLRIAAAVLCLAVGFCTAGYGLSFHEFYGDTYDPCNCGITPGGTDLKALMCWTAGPGGEHWPTTDMIRDALSSTFPTTGGIANSFNWAMASVDGDVWVDRYDAIDEPDGSDCLHGADIIMHYVGTAAVDWIQVYVQSGGAGNDTSGDPPPGKQITIGYDAEGKPITGTADDNPYYFNPEWNRDTFLGGHYAGVPFGDAPRAGHDESVAWAGGVQFYSVLASWSYVVDHNQFTLYDVVQWGYDGKCVPELPASVLAVLGSVCGFGVMALRRRR